MSNLNVIDYIADRLKKEPVGQLIKEEDVYEIVKLGMNKAFLEPTTDGRSGRRYPSAVIEFLDAHLKAAMTAAVEKWVAENGEKITDIIRQMLAEEAEAVAIKTLVAMMRPALSRDYNGIVNNINELRRHTGMYPLGSDDVRL